MVHLVKGNSKLGGVVKQIIKQNLRGQHGQKLKEQGSAGHGKHIAEIARGFGMDVYTFDPFVLEKDI